MNDKNNDVAFEPMDKVPAGFGPQDDGTDSYRIVEGDVFIDGKKVSPDEKVYVQVPDEAAV